jgi:hypothetical protein
MIQKTISIVTTELSQAQIWKLMSDVDEWKTWDESVEDSKLRGEFATGSEFMLKPKGGPRINIKLVDVKPGRYFRDQTSFPLAKMFGEHWYEPTQDGLRLTVTMTLEGPLSFLWNKLVMKDIVANLEIDLKKQIETAKKL